MLFRSVNNLHDRCLNSLLPVRKFRFLNSNEYKDIDWCNIDTKQENGYFIECDLNYPKEIHEQHQDFPLAPMKDKVLNEKLSPFQLNL